MRHTLLAAALLAGFLLQTARAEVPPAEALEASPGSGPVVERVEISGTLAAIDAATRRVTLDLDDGGPMSFVAGPEVQNFAQLAIGDRVEIEYLRALVLELRKGSTEEPWRIDDDQAIRAIPGEKPAGATRKVVRAVAEVIAVSPEHGTITVQGPRHVVELRIPDPERLAEIAVGDRIEAAYVEAAALSVTSPEEAR